MMWSVPGIYYQSSQEVQSETSRGCAHYLKCSQERGDERVKVAATGGSEKLSPEELSSKQGEYWYEK